MKAVEFPLAGRALSGLISACFQEIRKDHTELDTYHLDAQHNVEVFGGSKRKSGFAEKNIAGSAANKRVAIFVPGEILSEPVKSFHHVHCSRSWSTAMDKRSSGSSQNCAKRESGSTIWFRANIPGSYRQIASAPSES